MANHNPNQSGLRQNNKKKKNSKRTQKKLDAQVKALAEAEAKIEKVRANTNKFIDTYMISLADEYPNSVKTAKQLLKWKELKDREDVDDFLTMEY